MKLGVLVVTFNRVEELKKLLNIYDGDDAIANLVIVNNNSTDGTKEYLENLSLSVKSIKLFHLDKNTGGSGGFYHGLNYMKDLDLDWIYLSDDDAFPEGEIFKEFKKGALDLDSSKISAICTSVINHGEYDLYHRRYLKKNGLKIIELPTKLLDYTKQEFELDIFSYVGVFINNEKLSSNNMPERDYFIFYDDSEHALQLLKVGKIICWPKLRVNHNIKYESELISWKHFYGMRNKLHAYKKQFGYKVFYFHYFKLLIKALFIKDKQVSTLYFSAIKSAKNNILGVHNTYKPGWTYQSNN